MRILLLADIHANWPALQAIKEPFDACLVLGDLVDYGLEPAPVHPLGAPARQPRRARQSRSRRRPIRQGSGQERLQVPHRRHPRSHAGTHQRGRAPIPRPRCRSAKRVTLDGVKFLLVHATPRDPLDEYSIADADFWTRRLAGVDAQVICVGHTHHPVHPRSRRQARHQPRQRRPAARRRPARFLRHHREPARRTEARRISGRGHRDQRPGKQPARAGQSPARRSLPHRRSRQTRQRPRQMKPWRGCSGR